MMLRRFLPCIPLLLGLCPGVSALGALQIESAAVGDRTIVITVDDSIKAPDLGKIQVEGYSIENAAFVEEGDDSVRLSPDLVDLTAPGQGRIIDFASDPGLLILDASVDFIPRPGLIIADTSFGGLLRKIVSVEGAPQSVAAGSRWTLRTVEAGLPEAVLDCDLSFRSRVDLNVSLPDLRNSEEAVGALDDGTPSNGEVEYSVNAGRILFQPMISGRVSISQGKVDAVKIQVQGDCEVSANMRAGVNGTGEFEYEDELRARAPIMIPLGHGLFIKVQNRPFVRFEAQSRDDAFFARADFRVVNSLRGELGYAGGQWRPLADNRMTSESKRVLEFSGNGEIKMMLKPRIDVLIEGMQGPSFTFEPYARFASTTPPATRDPDSARTSGFGPDRPWLPGPGAAGTRELSIGANIYMDARTNFAGPAITHNFLLFNHEQPVMSPPKEGALSLKESDSSRIFLNCESYPKADFYVIQQKVGNGPWETVLENAPGPKVRLGNLKPSSQYRFRAMGVNAMGVSPAFPPEGIVYVTPAPNHPPLVPLFRFPDSGAVVADSTVVVSWRGGDPDPGSKVLYTVYLDDHYPPVTVRAAGIPDSSLAIAGLRPGQNYYWKISASDGSEKSESGVRAFALKAPGALAAAVPAGGAYPLALVPKGFYRREDGKAVKVGPLLMGKYEVTQAEFEKIMGRNPSYHLQDSLPVERVTWEEAETFCRETGGRLPTEAEWEYAARAGSASSFYWGRSNPGDYAWYRDNSDNRTQKVGMKKPNSWGLYDMAGNVFEWAQDWYGEYSADELDHPKGPASGVAKVIRGASWYSEGANLNLSARYNNRPGFRNFKVGFRCARDLENVSESSRPSSSLASKLPEAAPAGAPESAVP
jgi:formylglycine-generating enzyme required for sulfatase activity